MTSIIDTFKKLKERNSNPVWLWSMMLTRGLTWENVWSVFTNGVSTNSGDHRRDSAMVPDAELLFSLSDSPSNVSELFDRMSQIQASYPYKASWNYCVWNAESLNVELLKKAKGHVQCTWPQVKDVLDVTRNFTTLEQRNDFESFITQYCSDKPGLRAKTVLHMVQTQHEFVGTHAFVILVRACEAKTIESVWNAMQTQIWAEPEKTANFLGVFFQRGNQFNIPIAESLAFIKRHPELLPDMSRTIQAYAFNNPKDDAFFALALPLLVGNHDARINLYATMGKTISLATLVASVASINEQKAVELKMKPLVQAYLSMPANERDTVAAQSVFANFFQRVSISLEEYMNGHCNKLVIAALKTHPTGVMARIFALHACVVGLFPDDCSDDELKELKALFRHEPCSRTGHASIIKKVIPDFKEWFSMVQSLGLSRSEIWQQGMMKMASNEPDMSMVVDGAVFDGMVP